MKFEVCVFLLLISPEIARCTFQDCFDFRLACRENLWGYEEALEDLKNHLCNLNLATKDWVRNHFGLIVWKIGSTIRNVLFAAYSIDELRPSIISQLLYRYEREVNLAQRSTLKKISEGDEPVAGLFTFCMADMRISRDTEEASEILLTDGWYCLWTIIDKPTEKLIQSKKLFNGQKIQVCNVSLSKADPAPILEAENFGVKLKIAYNSIRMARWHEKLGRKRGAIAFSRPLKSVNFEGGAVPCVEVVIVKKYPETIVISMEDGKVLEKSKKEFEMMVDAQSIDPLTLKSVTKTTKILVCDGSGRAIVKMSNISDDLLLKCTPGRQLVIFNGKPLTSPHSKQLELRVYQSCRQCIPKTILESFEMEEEDCFPKEFLPENEYNLVLKFLRRNKSENYAWALTANGLLVSLSLGYLSASFPSFSENVLCIIFYVVEPLGCFHLS